MNLQIWLFCCISGERVTGKQVTELAAPSRIGHSPQCFSLLRLSLIHAIIMSAKPCQVKKHSRSVLCEATVLCALFTYAALPHSVTCHLKSFNKLVINRIECCDVIFFGNAHNYIKFA